MEKITVSAPGKLMLLGEHAVLYGEPCIVTAVGQRMRATVEIINEQVVRLDAPNVDVHGHEKPFNELGSADTPKGARFVEVAVRNFIEKHSIEGGVSVQTISEFSSQFGFGSSSASTVCVIKALSELFQLSLSEKEMFELAYKTVLDVQGKGSGFDVAAGIYGGTLYYIAGGKKIEPIPLDNLPLAIGYTGIKADTVTVIDQVKALADRHPERVEHIYTEIGHIVEDALGALQSQDWQKFGELMNFNQGYLEALEVSSQKLSSMIHGARDGGAFGAKLSGAGIGDCMIALAEGDAAQSVAEGIESAGGEAVDVSVNVEGVRVES